MPDAPTAQAGPGTGIDPQSPQFQSAQQAGIDQLCQRAIHCGPASAEAGSLHVVDELIRIEVMMLAEDVPHHIALLAGVPLRTWTAGQVLAELRFRTLGYGNGWQLHGPISSAWYTADWSSRRQ